MLDQAFLEALRAGFWPVYVVAMMIGVVSALVQKRWCIGRSVFALIAASIAQVLWEGSGFLLWWQHLVIDVTAFVLITMPPRHYWQSVLGGLVFAQLVLHCIWGAAGDVAGMARFHWLGCILLGYVKCLVLALWSGGWRVEAILGRIAGLASRVVLRAPEKEMA